MSTSDDPPVADATRDLSDPKIPTNPNAASANGPIRGSDPAHPMGSTASHAPPDEAIGSDDPGADT
jgi:hypothetical protein